MTLSARRAWQLLQALPLEASSGSLAGVQSWLAGLGDSVPEAVSAQLLARQRQAVVNAEAWAAPVCSWLARFQ